MDWRECVKDVGYKERLIAQKGFDDTRVLRVVYETLPDKIYNYYTLWSLPQVPIYVALLEKRP